MALLMSGKTSGREAVNTNFSNLWFDPIGKRTIVYHFSGKRTIHLTTNRFIMVLSGFANLVAQKRRAQKSYYRKN